MTKPKSSDNYPPFAVTVDLVIFTVQPPQLQVLLVHRDTQPFKKKWALPGGFVGIDQSLTDAAQFKLADKTGIDLDQAHLEQLATFGNPKRDPRMRTISVAYLAMVADPPSPPSPQATWVDIETLSPTNTAFDHHQILTAGKQRAQAKLEYTTLATKFCGLEFTIASLRGIYETVWGTSIDPANFHRKALASVDFITPTGNSTTTGKGRPAKTYRSGPADTLTPPIQRN